MKERNYRVVQGNSRKKTNRVKTRTEEEYNSEEQTNSENEEEERDTKVPKTGKP